MEESEQPNEFEAVKTRLEEIAKAVDDENLSLDAALDLYEEAVKLGLQASNLLETSIVVEDELQPDSEIGSDSSSAATSDSEPAPDSLPGTNPDALVPNNHVVTPNFATTE